MPDVIQKALESGPPARRSTGNRDSLQRKQYWWLPYVVLEFDKNEILVEALGGDLSKPEWNYRADLCVVRLLAHLHIPSPQAPSCSDVSRTSTVSVSAYLRTAQSLRGQEDMGNDILMARVELTPVLDGHVREAYRLTPSEPSMLTHCMPFPLRLHPPHLTPLMTGDRTHPARQPPRACAPCAPSP